LPIQDKIKSVQYMNNQIVITFINEWFQDDIHSLSQAILSSITEHQIKEHILGADRENIRFACQSNEFLLNFEYYSQSCWIDAHDPESQTNIFTLYRQLEANV